MTHDISTAALEIKGLRKSFTTKPAVDGLSLSIRRGEFYALLGPNGAGKTTTLRMVAGLLKPDIGTISICGIDAVQDPVEAKRVMAWVPDEPLIYDKLDPIEYLEFVAGLWAMDAAKAERQARELVQLLGLDAHASTRCQGLSKGMRQKVALAGALIHDPQLIILDEPLTGLDAGSARQVKAVLKDRVAAGATVIMTTHILEVAERMAERIGLAAQPGPTKYLHTPLTLKFVAPTNNAITRGFKQLDLIDEPYWPMFGDTNRIEVLAAADMEGQARPLIWTFQKGRGRVFASIIGHYTWSWDDPLVRILVLRGVAWAADEPTARFDSR